MPAADWFASDRVAESQSNNKLTQNTEGENF